MNWLNRCHFGDVHEVLRRMIVDGVKVNTIVTSPPYWGLRDYGHEGQIGRESTFAEFLATMVDVFGLLRQVLADDGTAWVNMGDCYGGISGSGVKSKDLVGQPWRLAFALQDAGWWLRQDIIWNKPAPMPESVRDRCTKAHEYIFLLAKSERYYFDFEAFQEPVNGGAHARRSLEAMGLKRPGFGHGYDAEAKPRYKTPQGWATGATAHTTIAHQIASQHPKAAPKQTGNPLDSAYADGKSERMGRGAGWRARKLAEAGSGTKNNTSMDEALAVMPATRNRRSVWTVASEPYSGAHFATFPTKLIEPCILAGCPAGGVVLDPFFGSGTTGQVAQQLGRKFIGIELNPAYKALQDERLRQTSLELIAA